MVESTTFNYFKSLFSSRYIQFDRTSTLTFVRDTLSPINVTNTHNIKIILTSAGGNNKLYFSLYGVGFCRYRQQTDKRVTEQQHLLICRLHMYKQKPVRVSVEPSLTCKVSVSFLHYVSTAILQSQFSYNFTTRIQHSKI